MSEVTKNPPLVSYYLAIVSVATGWNERALHIAFLLPAFAVILGVYRLAGHFTRSPLVAAAATLFTPGFLVSGTSVMCDISMLACWILAMVLWIEGLKRESHAWMIAAGAMVAVCGLTKYFGIALIPLLFVYTIMAQRRRSSSLFYLLIPVAALAGYQIWTGHLYGSGLLLQAARISHHARRDFVPLR